MKRIVSIKGGGIRGIIPCCHLVELERQTGALTRDVIDFVGGTSTGALLTASIIAGVPASAALAVYTEKGPEIFSPTNTLERDARLVATGHQFDNKVLYRVASDALGGTTMTMNDSPIGVMVTAGDQMGVPWYFVKDAPTNAQTTGKAPLLDAAVASACATTYHAPWLIPGFGYFADGGTVSLADPVYETMAEALNGPNKCYGSIDPGDALVVSLGTGYYQPAAMPPPPAGLLSEISWVTSSLVSSSETIALQAANRQWPRLVAAFDSALWADIDEADVTAIPRLLALGQADAAKVDWKKALKLP
ncbi:MAG: patatin-like phospholipase family protein [Bryobacteraceae bacterium]|jgi:patatin-like phospholipase/acyl hydrolase